MCLSAVLRYEPVGFNLSQPEHIYYMTAVYGLALMTAACGPRSSVMMHEMQNMYDCLTCGDLPGLLLLSASMETEGVSHHAPTCSPETQSCSFYKSPLSLCSTVPIDRDDCSPRAPPPPLGAVINCFTSD